MYNIGTMEWKNSNKSTDSVSRNHITGMKLSNAFAERMQWQNDSHPFMQIYLLAYLTNTLPNRFG